MPVPKLAPDASKEDFQKAVDQLHEAVVKELQDMYDRCEKSGEVWGESGEVWGTASHAGATVAAQSCWRGHAGLGSACLEHSSSIWEKERSLFQ